MTNTTNTTDLYSARWVSKAARIVKTEKSGWCAYLDIVDEDGQYIEAVNICRGISSREVAEALVRNWVRDFAAPAQAEAPAGVEPVGEIRASSELGVAPYADIWSWLQPGTKLYTADQVKAADSVLEDALRYRWLRINAIGAFRTNDGKGLVSAYHLSKIPAIPGIPEETDAAIDAAIAAQQGEKHE